MTHHRRQSWLSGILFGADYRLEPAGDSSPEEDIRLMKGAQFTAVSSGGNLWERLEPEPGRFDFAFLDERIDQLAGSAMRMILCTPTAWSPAWLSGLDPEILRVSRSGTRASYTQPHNACYNSPIYRSRVRALLVALGAHFHPVDAVAGWQIETSEPGVISDCRCSRCTEAYSHYLSENHGSIAALNRAWGLEEQGQSYSSFDQIALPEEGEVGSNPAQLLDYHLFRSREYLSFAIEQIDILRDAQPAWFLTHGLTESSIDYLELSTKLDFAACSFFPMSFPPQDRGSRSASSLDAVRSISGNFLVSRLQSGAHGSAGTGSVGSMEDTPHPGQMRLFVYQAIAHGADGILHAAFRTANSPSPQFRGGIIANDGRAGARYEELCREGDELARLGANVTRTTPAPEVGILLDRHRNQLIHLSAPYGLPPPESQAETVHRLFFEAGYSVGYVHRFDSFSSFKLLVVAGLPFVSAELAGRLATYVEMGGTLLVTARSGVQDELGRLLPIPGPGYLRDLCGIQVGEYTRVNHPDLFPNSIVLAPPGGAENVPPSLALPTLPQQDWLECLDLVSAEVLGAWEEYPHAGRNALTLNRTGLGKTIYLGTMPSAANLHPLLFPLAGEASLVPLVSDPTPGVEVAVRECDEYRLYFVMNHTPQRLSQSGLPAGELLVGADSSLADSAGRRSRSVTLEGYDVALIRAPRSPSP